MGFPSPIWEEIEPYATEEDYAECSRLHRQHGTTYYFASRRLPAEVRKCVDAVYGFVRVPDEWVDNPDPNETQGARTHLSNYRQEMLAATYGRRPSFAVLRAFGDVQRACKIPLEEPLAFLDAMEADLTISRYADYEALRGYMRGSAVAVGLMMLRVLGTDDSLETKESAIALGEAMQLTNFLRDIAEDFRRGRVYLPQDEMDRFRVLEDDLANSRVSRAFIELMRFQIARARELYAQSDLGIEKLPDEMRFGVALARELYAKILEKIEAANYDVFRTRVRTTPQEKMVAAWRIWSGSSA